MAVAQRLQERDDIVDLAWRKCGSVVDPCPERRLVVDVALVLRRQIVEFVHVTACVPRIPVARPDVPLDIECDRLAQAVAPPKADRWGPGLRIPAMIVSPYARMGTVDHTLYDTTSILRFITRRFNLPILAGLAERDVAGSERETGRFRESLGETFGGFGFGPYDYVGDFLG